MGVLRRTPITQVFSAQNGEIISCILLGIKQVDKGQISTNEVMTKWMFFTIIPRAWMGSESIVHEAEGQRGNWLRGHEGERNNNY